MKHHDLTVNVYYNSTDELSEHNVEIFVDYIDDSFDYEYGSEKGTHESGYYELIDILGKEEDENLITFLIKNHELAIHLALNDIEHLDLEDL